MVQSYLERRTIIKLHEATEAAIRNAADSTPPLLADVIEFQGLVDNGRYYTLDGKKEILAPSYTIFISEAAALSKDEIQWIVDEYLKMKGK